MCGHTMASPMPRMENAEAEEGAVPREEEEEEAEVKEAGRMTGRHPIAACTGEGVIDSGGRVKGDRDSMLVQVEAPARSGRRGGESGRSDGEGEGCGWGGMLGGTSGKENRGDAEGEEEADETGLRGG